MPIGNVLGEFMIRSVWPWVVKHLWPIVVKYIQQLVAHGLGKLGDRLIDAIRTRMQSRAEQAEMEATVAERAARSAASIGERDKQEAIAKVWRQVAEQFRQENEDLRRQVADLTKAQDAELCSEVSSTTPRLDTTGESPTVQVGNANGAVPALPLPTNGASSS